MAAERTVGQKMTRGPSGTRELGSLDNREFPGPMRLRRRLEEQVSDAGDPGAVRRS